MSDEKSRGVAFAVKRQQAMRNASDHVSDVLWKVAENIVKAVRKYRPYYTSKTMSNEAQYAKEVYDIASKAATDIEAYVESYAKASIKVLGLTNKNLLDNYLQQEVFGKTYQQRNREYLRDFADDIVELVKAGVVLRYDETKLINAVRSSYRDPYNLSVMTKASKEGKYAMSIPHRGKGIHTASYENIIRNVQNTIHLAWGQSELEYGKEGGFMGYYVHRGSSYECDICQSQVGWLHRLDDMVVPLHNHCQCYVTFAISENDNPLND